jgi:acyl-CoA dehydrogenase
MAMFATPRDLPDELLPYSGKLSDRFYEVRQNVAEFCQEIKAVEDAGWPEGSQDQLKAKARERGLWNFFLPEVSGITVMEYSPIAEMLGAVPSANMAMNCSAPDTGNMEVLAKYGNAEQKKQWLEPLLNQDIRSAFAMTEPGVASSDATNISSSIVRDGDEYVFNGHKWYISGACRPECKVFVFLGRTTGKGDTHNQHSMILVPRDAKGVTIVRPLGVLGHIHDHAEIVFDNVRVPVSNML